MQRALKYLEKQYDNHNIMQHIGNKTLPGILVFSEKTISIQEKP